MTGPEAILDEIGAFDPEGLAVVRASGWHNKPVPSREWHVPELIPAGTVTMLNGDGGVGKSLLALQLAFATATSGEWIGTRPRGGKCLFVTAEDDIDELHRRAWSIVEAGGFTFDRANALAIVSLAGEDAVLAAAEGRSGVLKASALFDKLKRTVETLRPCLIVLDTLADLFAGEENNRAHARQFVGILRGLCKPHGATVLILAHPSLSGMASGSGTSGSTAWNNSVRSRLYLRRIVDGEYEPNPDARVLTTMKANYGRTGGEVMLTWRDGVFVSEAKPQGFEALAAQVKGERVFLALLDEYKAQGRYVSAQPGPTYAPAQFAKHPGREGCTKAAFVTAMNVLFNRGDIVMAEHGKGAKARSHIARKGSNYEQD
jgi:RecA-family ATPase